MVSSSSSKPRGAMMVREEDDQISAAVMDDRDGKYG